MSKNKYIEINENNEIIDVFFDWQKQKMQSQTITNGITKTVPQIKAKWAIFKKDFEALATKQEIDNAYEELDAWLEE